MAEIPQKGDRSAWDTISYATKHAKDIEDATLRRHMASPGTAGNVMRDDGTNWVSVAPVSYLPFAPTARGDMIYANAVPAWARLALGGASGSVLTRNATDPAWSGFYLAGTAGGTVNFAVTNTKTLTLTATDNYNLTIPATGTAVLGTGTTSYVPRFSGTNTIAAGVIQDDGTGVGMGVAPTTNSMLYIYKAVTDPASSVRPLLISAYVTATAAPDAQQNYAFVSTLYVQGTNTHTGANIGFLSNVYHNGSNTASILESFRTSIGCLSTGGVTNLYGGRIFVYSPGAGAIGSLIGLEINYVASTITGTSLGLLLMSNTTALAGVNKYAIQINDVSGGATNYAIQTFAGNIVFNEGGDANTDVRMEGDTLANLFFLDASADKIGINDPAPAYMLDVGGDIDATGVYRVDDVQVVSNRIIDARCDDVINSGDATTDGVIDSLRDAMITHGLIAAA